MPLSGAVQISEEQGKCLPSPVLLSGEAQTPKSGVEKTQVKVRSSLLTQKDLCPPLVLHQILLEKQEALSASYLQ